MQNIPPQNIPFLRRALKSLVTILLLLSVSACQQKVESFKTAIFTFGTVVNVEVADVTREQSQQIFNSIEEDLTRMNVFWHPWKLGALARTNVLCELSGSFSAASSVIPLLIQAKKLAIKSEHLFNPAIGKLVKLWGFQQDDFDMNVAPDDADIQALVKANPRMTDVKIKGIRVTCNNPAIRIDLGAIAKGYALEQIITNLQQTYGVKNIIINAGGDLKALGQRGDRPWQIGIRDPQATDKQTAIATIKARSGDAIFTSGSYERYYTENNKRYHHIIDPRTGYPAKGSLSVTVIHPNATVADAAATAIFIAGPNHWVETAKRMGIKYVLLIDDKNNIHVSQAMLDRVEFIKEPEKLLVVRF